MATILTPLIASELSLRRGDFCAQAQSAPRHESHHAGMSNHHRRASLAWVYEWNPTGPASSASMWRDEFYTLQGASQLTLEQDQVWTGRLDWQKSQAYSLHLATEVQATGRRRAQDIRSDPRGTYALLVQVMGTTWIGAEDSSGDIGPDSLVLADFDRPIEFINKDRFPKIVMNAPQEEVSQRSPALTRTPRMLSAASGVGRMIRRMAITLQEERECLTENIFDTACSQLLDLVCLAAEGATDTAPRKRSRHVEADVRRYIRWHADDPRLNIAGVAKALGWSTRYVQQILNDAGTTSRELIREERLLLARTRLTSPSWAGQSVASIAYSCGFNSHAVFTKAFRQEFHMTPRDARKDG